MLLMIDNYDSFTFNLVQYFGELGQEVRVFRNDEITVQGIAALKPDQLVLSPGPCSPAEAGICVEAIRHFTGKLPILGVCLGHQAIGAALGGKVVRAQVQMHGKASTLSTDGRGVYQGLPSQFRGDPLPLAGHRTGDAAGLPGGHRPPPRTARSWACATATWPARPRRWKACSSTPRASSANMATPCCATSSR
jgi:GMP synthase-like glutamine amidotransferase